MKTLALLVLATLLLGSVPLPAQQQRVSPHETISTVLGDRRTGNRVTVTYGRPYSKNPRSAEVRKVWGGLVPYDRAWRLGADEATLLITQQPIVLGGATVPAGAYTLYMVPAENGASKLAISKKIGQWGVPVDETQDRARVDLKKETLEKTVDQLTLVLDKDAAGTVGTLKIQWENTQFSVDFTVQK